MKRHRRIFTVAITSISRMLILRDRMLGRIGRFGRAAGVVVARERIASGRERIDTVFVDPEEPATRAAVLICHGIGEIVERWFPVQQVLAAGGAASLVFDYSGYGRSTGAVTAEQCETDAVAALAHLRKLTPGRPVVLLGFSLGSGVAAAVIDRVDADGLVLCAAFTSYQEAARSGGVPRWLVDAVVPDIWATERTLGECPVPVLIVHGDRDWLFPVAMAERLAVAGGANAELVVVPGLSHNQPFSRPGMEYWGEILTRLPRVLQVVAGPK